jgi:hypothetical protein
MIGPRLARCDRREREGTVVRRDRAASDTGAKRREHRIVVTNLMAMQARLRGDAVIPVHPSARIAVTPSGGVQVRHEDLTIAQDLGPEVIAEVIALPGAAERPVSNPLPEGAAADALGTTHRLEELQGRMDRLETDLVAMLDRLEPGASATSQIRGSVEDAIVRLQQAIDRRLGSS